MNRKIHAISRVATIVIIVVIIIIAAVSVVVYSMYSSPTSSNIKIGMAMPLSGALSGNGAAALLALQIWANDTNANGGLLGRHVQLVYYDDATNAQNDPGLYTKLITVDHVDLLISPYGTVDTVPAIAVAKQYNMLIIGTFALGANSQYNYSNYFSSLPPGPQPFIGWSQGFFSMAQSLSPKPQKVAVIGVQNAYGAPCAAGASQNAVNDGFQLVYNSTYPASTSDFTSTLEAVQATNPDILFACSYPPDSVSILQTMKTLNFTPKICCGGMVGLGFGTILPTLGPLLNGVVNYETWAPATTITFPGMTSFLAKYQPLAVSQKLDPLGYYLPPFAYMEGQLISTAVTATQSLNSTVLANYLHTHTISTIVGNLVFGSSGEWATPRMFYVQFQGITNSSLSQFEVPSHWVVVAPPQYVSGTLEYPFPGWQ